MLQLSKLITIIGRVRHCHHGVSNREKLLVDFYRAWSEKEMLRQEGMKPWDEPTIELDDTHYQLENDTHYQSENDTHYQSENDTPYQLENDTHYQSENDTHYQSENDTHYQSENDTHYQTEKK